MFGGDIGMTVLNIETRCNMAVSAYTIYVDAAVLWPNAFENITIVLLISLILRLSVT